TTSIGHASSTTRGSAVIIPSTSVKISTLSARNDAPNAAAVVSLPPRPIVLISPSSVLPWKPATTTTSCVFSSCLILPAFTFLLLGSFYLTSVINTASSPFSSSA